MKHAFALMSKSKRSPLFGAIDQTIDFEDLIGLCKRMGILSKIEPLAQPLKVEETPLPEESKGEEGSMREEEEKRDLETPVAEGGAAEGATPAEVSMAKADTSMHQSMGGAPCVTIQQLIAFAEKYYTRESTLEGKLARARSEEDKRRVFATHLMNVKGAELIYFELKEVLLEVALFLREQADPGKAPKVGSVMKKFLEEQLFANFGLAEAAPSAEEKKRKMPPRVWPQSEKDKTIRIREEEQRKMLAEEEKRREELRRQEEELRQMEAEDTPALSAEEIRALKRRLEEEKARAREEEKEDEEEEEEDDEMVSHGREEDDY